jgi:hypothetical protein
MNPMIDFFEQIAINAGIGAIMMAVKNPDKAALIKNAMSHLADGICAAYGWSITKN